MCLSLVFDKDIWEGELFNFLAANLYELRGGIRPAALFAFCFWGLLF